MNRKRKTNEEHIWGTKPANFFLSECPHCKSLRDRSEATLCCHQGKRIVSEEMFPDDSEYVSYCGSIPNICEIARELNNAVALTSIGTTHSRKDRTTGFVYRVQRKGPRTMYGLHGRTFHRFQNLASYLQWFPTATKFVSEALVEDFMSYIRNNHCYGRMYRTVREMVEEEGFCEEVIKIHPNDIPMNASEPFVLTAQRNNWLEPVATECLLIPNDGRKVEYVGELSCVYDVCQYPILYPTGRGGFYKIKHQTPKFLSFYEKKTVKQESCKTVMTFMKYVLTQRAKFLSTFSTASQQYILDQFSRAQSIAFHQMGSQKEVLEGMVQRMTTYKEIKKGEGGARPFMLPASVLGSPACQKKLIRDGMAVIGKLGKPTLFITFTGNTHWPEFREAIREQMGHCDYENPEALFPDLLVRIFRQKLLQFEDDLRKGKFFPHHIVYIQRVIEFQKRYIPHAHIIVRLSVPHPVTADFVDSVITTRLFYHELCPLFDEYEGDYEECMRNQNCDCDAHKLHRTVFSKMRHTKCTERCHKKNGKKGCKYGYPYNNAGAPSGSRSYEDNYGYWKPRRLYECDALVVPYNAKMCYRYDAHINVEVCAGIHVVKYLRKYLSKIPDSTRVSLEKVMRNPRLEFDLWQKHRHVGVSECILRIRDIDINKSKPAATALVVHDEGRQAVYARRDETLKEAGQRTITQLMRYFSRNEALFDKRYEEYYEQYTLRNSEPNGRESFPDNPSAFGDFKVMFAVKRRVKDTHVCRLEVPLRRDSEFNALVQIIRRAPKVSWIDCKSHEGVIYRTYVEAARAMNIPSGSDDYDEVLKEAINPNDDAWLKANVEEVVCVTDPYTLRRLFIMLCMSGASAAVLMNKFMFFLTADYAAMKKRSETREAYFYRILKKELLKDRMDLGDLGIEIDEEEIDDDELLKVEKNRYDNLKMKSDSGVKLTQEQANIAKAVIQRVDMQDGTKAMYIGARAGRGKTVLAKYIIAKLRLKAKIVLVACPSAKAATHYDGATTLHKAFGIPIDIEAAKNNKFQMTPKHTMSRIILLSSLIVIDEFAMTHAAHVSFIDSFLRYLCKTDEFFGGKVVLLLGDGSQLPPVDVYNEGLLATSPLFHPVLKDCIRYRMSPSIRQKNDPLYGRFNDGLGEGVVNGEVFDGLYDLNIPEFVKNISCMEHALKLHANVEDMPKNTIDLQQLCRTKLYRSIAVSFTNLAVREMNCVIQDIVREHINENAVLLLGHHEIVCEKKEVNLATEEFMQGHIESGVPQYEMNVFRGALVMLLRNFIPSRRLVNGARFIIARIYKNHIVAMHADESSPFFGEYDVFFRFKFRVTGAGYDFERQQYPFVMTYANTVHKMQGDTVHEEGTLLIDFSRPSFCYAQAYVALTRAKNSKQVTYVASCNTVTVMTSQALVQEDPELCPEVEENESTTDDGWDFQDDVRYLEPDIDFETFV